MACYHLYPGGCSLVDVGVEDVFWLPLLTVSTMSLATQFSKHVSSAHYLLGTVLGAKNTQLKKILGDELLLS